MAARRPASARGTSVAATRRDAGRRRAADGRGKSGRGCGRLSGRELRGHLLGDHAFRTGRRHRARRAWRRWWHHSLLHDTHDTWHRWHVWHAWCRCARVARTIRKDRREGGRRASLETPAWQPHGRRILFPELGPGFSGCEATSRPRRSAGLAAGRCTDLLHAHVLRSAYNWTGWVRGSVRSRRRKQHLAVHSLVQEPRTDTATSFFRRREGASCR